MSFLQFPSIQEVIVFETGETTPLGWFSLDERLELVNILLRLFKNGTSGGSESLTLKVWGSENYNGTPIASSTAYLLSSIVGLTSAWIGDIAFTFDRQNLNKNQRYYVTMTVASYTRSGTTYYLGACKEWPFAFNTVAGAGPAARLTIVGYKEQQ